MKIEVTIEENRSIVDVRVTEAKFPDVMVRRAFTGPTQEVRDLYIFLKLSTIFKEISKYVIDWYLEQNYEEED